MITLYLFLIALMVVYVYDVTGFPQAMLRVLWRYAYKTKPFPDNLSWEDIHPLLKIFECSLCATWWITLIVSICCGWWSLPIMAYCMLLSYLTPIFKDVMFLVRDFVARMIDAIATYFCL